MSQSQLGILIEAAIDSVNSKAKLNAQIKQLQVDALKIGVQLDTASAKQAIKQLQAQQDSFYKRNLNGIDAEIAKRKQASQIFSAQIKAQMQEAVAAEKSVAAARKQSVVNDTFATNIKKSQQDLLKLKDSFSAINNNPNLTAKWQELFDAAKVVRSREELQNLNAKIGLFRKEIGASNTVLGQSAATALKMIVAMKALQVTLRSFNDAIRYIKELDNALNTISLTMNLTKSQLVDFGNKAIEMSKNLGASATQVLKAAQIYANMNESVNSILAKSKPTVMLSTASGLDTSTTADIIQGIMQQFNIAETEAMRIVDVIENLSANIAVDYQKGISTISEAIQTSGSVAEEAGLSYEKYAAIVSATAEKTRQSGSVLGNAYKTIFSRISRSNTEDASIEEISKAEKAFESVGVSVRDAQGQFRNIGDTLDELSAKWGSLDSVQRSYIAEQAAGVRQKNVFLATMNSYTSALELEKGALESSGFALETNDKYMQSFKAHAEVLKTTLNEFWTQFIDSDVLIFLTDLGTESLETVNDLGGLQNILILITGLLAAKNWGSITSIFTGIVGKIKDIPTAFKTAKQESAGLSGALNLLGISASTAQLAIGALTAVITMGIAAYSHFRQIEEDARQAALAAADEANQQTNAITELTGKYVALSEAVDLDESSKAELLSVQEQLLQNFKLEGQTLDDLTAKYGSLTNAIKEKSVETLKAAQIDLTAGIGANEKNLLNSGSDGFWGGNNIINATGDDAVLAFKALEKAGILNSGSFGSGGGAFVLTGNDSTVDGIIENYNRLGDALKVLQDGFSSSELTDNSLFNAINNRYKELQPIVNNYNSSIENLNNNLAQQEILQSLQGQEVPKTKEAFDVWSKGVVDSAKNNEDFIGSVGDVENSIMSLISKMPEFKQFFSEVPNQSPVSLVSTKELEEVRKATDTLVSSARSLSSAFEEQRESGRLSAEAILGIVDAGYAAALQMDQETGIVTINQQAYIALAQAKIQEQIITLQAQRNSIVSELIAEAKAAKIAAGGHLTNAQAIQIENAAKSSNANIQALDAQIEALNQIDLSRITSGLYHVGNAAKNAANEMKQAMSSAQSAINSLLSMTISMIKQNYANQKDALQDLKDAEKDRYDTAREALEKEYDQQKKNYDLQKQAIEDATNAAKENLDLRLKALQAEKDAYYWNKELSKQNKSVADIEADISTIGNDDSEEGIAKRRELEALLAEEKEKLADMQYEHSVEIQEKALNDEYDLFEQSQNDKLNALEKQNQYKDEIHQAELNRLETEHNTYIDQLDAKIKAIDEYTKLESNIRAEAIKMIEDKNSDLYQKLLKWNKIYGTSLDADVKVAWNNAQTALGNYNVAQLGVKGVLELLIEKMDGFERATRRSVDAMQDLEEEANNVNNSKAKTSETAASIQQKIRYAIKQRNLSQDAREKNEIQAYIEELQEQLKNATYHTGGVVTKGNRTIDNSLGLKENETVIKAKVGEYVISHDDPDRTRKLMTAFFNSDKNIAEFMNSTYDTAGVGGVVFDTTPLMSNTDFSKYERVNNSNSIDIKQGDIIIQGNADKSTVMDIKKVTEGVTNELLRNLNHRGIGNFRNM